MFRCLIGCKCGYVGFLNRAPPPKKEIKRNKGKVKTTKKIANKRKVDNPPISEYEMDTDLFYEMSSNEGSE